MVVYQHFVTSLFFKIKQPPVFAYLKNKSFNLDKSFHVHLDKFHSLILVLLKIVFEEKLKLNLIDKKDKIKKSTNHSRLLKILLMQDVFFFQKRAN